jgi:hypothetical protein
MDEVYAVNWQGKLPKTKRSFGTALKFIGKDHLPNALAYTNLIVLAVVILSDDYVMDCMCHQDAASHDPHSAAGIFDNFLFKHSDTMHR